MQLQKIERRTPAGAAALERLMAGNARFAHNVRSVDVLAAPLRRQALIDGQSPFAVVLSCSDSRVPSEIVFDQGLGDLFVVRVAGNVIAPSLVGSVEFAASRFGTPLVMVLGHTRCGAVAATLEAMRGEGTIPSENIGDIVERIRPAVEEALRRGVAPDEILAQAIRANVRASVRQLRAASRVLEQLVATGRLTVMGAEYSLETGEVCLLE